MSCHSELSAPGTAELVLHRLAAAGRLGSLTLATAALGLLLLLVVVQPGRADGSPQLRDKTKGGATSSSPDRSDRRDAGKARPARADQQDAESANTITEDEALAFGQKFTRAIDEQDRQTLLRSIDVSGLTEQVETTRKEVDESTRENNSRSASPGTRDLVNGGILKLLDPLLEQVAGGATVKVVRVRLQAVPPVLLVRVLDEETGANYWELPLRRSPKGEVLAADLRPFSEGLALSEMVSRSLTVAGPTGTETEGAPQTKAEWNRLKQQFEKIQQQIQAGDGAGALALFRQLPKRQQEDRMFLLCRVGAARLSDDQELLSALDELNRLHGPDPSIDFQRIDACIVRGELPKAIAAIDRANDYLGNDAWLLATKASLQTELKQYRAARQSLNAALASEPDLPDIYHSLVSLTLAESKFEETASALNTLEKDLGQVFADNEELPEFAQFLKSTAGKAWLKQRARASP